MTPLHPSIIEVTARITKRSAESRQAYLDKIERAARQGVHRGVLSCGNLAHGFAACSSQDKALLAAQTSANVGIISAYNDMLSAHQPFQDYPAQIKAAVARAGAVAQVAGAVPAMCDGVTQGQAGMELSLFSREVIALSASIGLSHNMFDSVIYLGVCDKIVPGLLIAALSFGHLPAVFVPAGPMTTGISNDEKALTRERYARGEIGRKELLESESKSYHGAGTCTFYGTANSNQALIEAMGLHVPDASFAANPNTPLRTALTEAAALQACKITQLGDSYRPIGRIVDERAIVNAVVMLLATGGSTNHTLHWIAVAAAAGIQLTWDDMDQLSRITPLIARVYPNGKADVNHFAAAGGLPFVLRELCSAGLMHENVNTIMGTGLAPYFKHAKLDGKGGTLQWHACEPKSADTEVLRPCAQPFQPDGGLRLLTGNLGRSVIKISAVDPERWYISAPARIFSDQEQVLAAFKAGALNQDCVVVLRFQGPKANGMPELHKLTPALSVLQKLGYRVAFLTDGRMSGASGKVPAAIHITPEALDKGAIAKLKDGDMITLDARNGTLNCLSADFEVRKVDEMLDQAQQQALQANQVGMGRELFGLLRKNACAADQGASIFGAL